MPVNPILKSRLEQGAKLRSYELEITTLSLTKAKPLQEGDSLEGEGWGGHGWARQKIGGFFAESAAWAVAVWALPGRFLEERRSAPRNAAPDPSPDHPPNLDCSPAGFQGSSTLPADRNAVFAGKHKRQT